MLDKTIKNLTMTAALLAATPVFALSTSQVLFLETFDGVTQGYHGNDPRRFGVPTADIFGTDEDWFAARFEQPDNGLVRQDVGIQFYGGGGNSSQTGLAEDDAGLMFQIATTGLTDVTLSFDWRTFSVGSHDELVVGYFVGDLAAGHPLGFEDRSIDLRTTDHGGPADGAWNFEGGGWIELGRFGPNNSFSTESFLLAAAGNSAEVWIAFWMDGGEGDYVKFDNVLVTATPVPLPAALWLFAAGLGSLLRLRSKA